MAYCSDCGTPINDDEEYCASCKPSHETPVVEETEPTEVKKNKIDLNSKLDFLKPYFWPIICGLLLIFLVLFIVLYINESNKEIVIPVDNTANLQGQITALNGQLDAERDYSYQLTTDLGEAKAEVASLETTIKDLKDTIAEKNKEIAEYKANKTEDDGKYNQIVADLAVAENKLSACEKELADKKAYIEGLEKQLALATSELNSYKSASTSELENELYKMRNPRAFSSIEELKEFLYYDDTDYKYSKLSDVDKGYILYQHLMREGYFVSFMVENVTGTISLTGANYVYIENLGVYRINPVNDEITIHRPNQSLDIYTSEIDDYPYITR